MPMLTDKIRLTGSNCIEPEEIFFSALAVIFPDDINNQHGDSSCNVIYDSAVQGEILLSLADPKGQDVFLFSHFVWNAAVQLAVLLEMREEPILHENSSQWDVRGHHVLELGAGTGLSGIVACLMGAEKTVITDYPATEVLANIQVNITHNVISRSISLGKEPPIITCQAHEWGLLQDSFSLAHQCAFTRILVCDCLWMPWQHENLRASIAWFLAEQGQAWVVSGFHTGREKMRGFFEEISLQKAGLELERIWERNSNGMDREWLADRGQESITELKGWLVIAVLRKRTTSSFVSDERNTNT
ncbi:Protein N-terminal and lysine N-methyltransferase EFM7 [Golovinomyces cichoracearum]|uniref:Protein N-terminal and lysine N-methyltransferase EFM7 n=1 Tax=Golovinomyces cichoracearum TaxID=62708 RepID=A0A420J593_9PEZI|nr:Protein N-terminal and lysine N-methyltransferase EFM7 [Golovinomyces cichoracearum]